MKQTEQIPEAIYERGYVYQFRFHLTWCTHYQNEFFHDRALAEEMKQLLLQQAAISDITVEEIAVMPDYVHMLIRFKPKVAPSTVVKCLKGHSGKLFLKRHPEIRAALCENGHLWDSGYYMGTIGQRNNEAVQTYIRGQKKRTASLPTNSE